MLVPWLDERKLAGILAESTTAGPSGTGREDPTMVVVVGMGMNLRWGRPPPSEVAARAATLTEVVGRAVDRDDVLSRYLRCLELWLARAEAGGQEVVLERYRRSCLTIGRRLRFATGDGEYRGTATDISPTGTLLMDAEGHGPIELHAGDAHHLG